MKKHAIIPIFIPHQGCPNDCVFCNQKKITARQPSPSEKEVTETIESYLSTLTGRGLKTIEIAFFGGSFTALPFEEQHKYLEIAFYYKQREIVDKIHLSTRPDYISPEILDYLKRYSVDIIELGVQSFDDTVLMRSGRGHDSKVVYKSAALIKQHGFELGIQLMIGLPGDTFESCVFSAKETILIGPAIARLYPAVVIADTELMSMYQRGDYVPLSTDEAIATTKKMYKILDGAGINIIRVGLKSSDLIQEGKEITGHFHPAFRQLVEGEIAREQIEAAMINTSDSGLITFASSPRSFSNMIGHGRRNKIYFQKQYPNLKISYKEDPSLADNQYIVIK